MDEALMPLDAAIPDILTPRVGLLTDDAYEILRFAADAFDTGLGCALITLVEIQGGAARALGAQMAVSGDGIYCGYVSGGCTEAAVAAEAIETIKTGFDRYLRLGEGSKFFDIVLPCGGGINLSIHILRESETLRSALVQLAQRKRTSLVYNPQLQSLNCNTDKETTGWKNECFVRSYQPKVQIVISGGAIEVEATSRLAEASGYKVLPLPLSHEIALNELIDEDTAVVILHHDLEREVALLKAALDSNPFYIGALGSLRTHGRRVAELQSLGYNETDISRIKAPIGIFGKARDSSSLALSILADIASSRTTGGQNTLHTMV